MAEVKILNRLIFRRANIKDLKDILRLDLELFKNEYRKFDKSLDLRWTYGNGKRYFKNRIIKKDGFLEVVENRKIIGYLCGGVSKGKSWRKKAKYAELEDMFIEKKFRNKGIGAKLTKDFVNWCKQNKVNYIFVSASAKNNLGINFYRKCGFQDYDLILEMKITK